jgi:hypothetical protein
LMPSRKRFRPSQSTGINWIDTDRIT